MKTIFSYKFTIVLALVLGISITACQDQLNIEPAQSLSPEVALSDFDGLTTALFGAYNDLQTLNWYGRDFLVYPEITGDLVFLSIDNSNRFVSDYQYLYADNDTQGFWDDAYSSLLRVNTILERIDDADVPVESDRSQVKAECLTIRAMAHFDLSRAFAQPYSAPGIDVNAANSGVPVVERVLAPDEEPARNTLAEVYSSVLSDLDDAINLFPDNNGEGPFRFTKDGATALRARVKLYMGDYNGAATDAGMLISSGRYAILDGADYVTAWQSTGFQNEIFTLQFLVPENRGSDNWGEIYNPDGYGDIRPSIDIKDLYADDPNDVRAGTIFTWDNGQDYTNKYFGSQGISGLISPKILRLEEMYLIRAEALAETGNLDGAISDLNAIRQERGVYDLTNPGTSAGVIQMVLDERARELAFEGHRAYDIFRRGLTEDRDQELQNPSLSVDAPTEFPPDGDTKWRVYPIPRTETEVNQNIVQNTGF